MNITQDQARYEEQPAIIFFEYYVLHVIGYLPKEKQQKIASLNLSQLFNVDADSWQNTIRKVLYLSDTLDIAIFDNWIDTWEQTNPPNPATFALDFTDRYFAKNSVIDVWSDEQLQAAVERIQRYLDLGVNQEQQQAQEAVA